MYRIAFGVLVALLALGSASAAVAQSLGSACTGSSVTSQLLDGGLLRCNGSTYAGANIYANSITGGTPTDGFGHAILTNSGGTNTGYVSFYTPNNAVRVGYVGYGNTTYGIGMYTDNSYPISFFVSGTQAMTIKPGAGTTGYVGIGTTNPIFPLVISANSDNSHTLNVRGDPVTFSLPATLLGPILQGVNSAQNVQMPISIIGSPVLLNPTADHVGIGTTNPVYLLDVNGQAHANSMIISGTYATIDMRTAGVTNDARISMDGSGNFGIDQTTGAGNFYVLSNGGAKFSLALPSGNATFSGTVTANGVLLTSDRRLKTNIQQLSPDVFEKLALIQGVTFNWNDKTRDQAQQVGVIAQDVQKAYPQLVTADASGSLAVNYAGLTAPLIEAVKQLKAQNDKLTRELDVERQQAALDHDLLFKIRQHIALPPAQITSYTESAWQYGPH